MVYFGNDRYQSYLILNCVFTMIGCIASILSLLLISRIWVKTTWMRLLYVMNFTQFISVIFCFPVNIEFGYYISVVSNFFEVSSGLSSSITSNLISYITFHIVFYRQGWKYEKYIGYFIYASFLPGIIEGIVYLAASIPQNDTNTHTRNTVILDAYNYPKLASIILNFLFCFSSFYIVHSISSKKEQKSLEEIAIQTLVYRLSLYPIVQAIGRVGKSWYEIIYGADFYSAGNATNNQYAAMIVFTIFTPLISVGYLIILLVMQPKAYEHFCHMFFNTPLPKNFSIESSNSSLGPAPLDHSPSTITIKSSETSEKSVTSNYMHEKTRSKTLSKLHSTDWLADSSFDIHLSLYRCSESELCDLIENNPRFPSERRSRLSILNRNSTINNLRPSIQVTDNPIIKPDQL